MEIYALEIIPLAQKIAPAQTFFGILNLSTKSLQTNTKPYFQKKVKLSKLLSIIYFSFLTIFYFAIL